MFRAIIEPLATPIARTCQKVTTPVKSSTPSNKVSTPLPDWLMIIRCFLDMRSASAPPMSETKVEGNAKDIITSASARGESSTRRSTSQLRVIICMFIAVNETKEPAQIQRKSR